MKPTISELKQDIKFTAELRGNSLDFSTTWGVFSPTEVDSGSRLLIEAMEISPADDILDIGCGYGAIGLAAQRCAIPLISLSRGI